MDEAEVYPYMGDLPNDVWYVSDAMKKIWGFEDNIVHDFVNKWTKFIISEEHLKLFHEDIYLQFIGKRNKHDLIYKVRDIDNNELWVRCCGMVRWNEEKTVPLYFCGQLTILKRTLEVDYLTNFLQEESALKEIAQLLQNKIDAKYLCFRLNNFNYINDILTKAKANILLSEIANSLSVELKEKISFFRLEGLRFLAIVYDVDMVESIGDKIKFIVEQKYNEYGIFINSSCDVGIIQNDEDEISAHNMMNYIMNTFEMIKKKEVDVYNYSSYEINIYKNKKKMLLALNKDVYNNLSNFRVVVQPIVGAESHQILGGEVLLRWNYNDRPVSPIEFIPELEKANLISIVGKWVFTQSAIICMKARKQHPLFFVDFNVSYHQIKDNSFRNLMQETMEDDRLENGLVMELTESHYNDNPTVFSEFTEFCEGIGLRLALDDFGSGFSSFEILFEYPAEIIKLDKNILNKISGEQKNAEFISTIIDACGRLGKTVCAEGVETKEQLNTLKMAEADLIQGYYFYKPMELHEFYNEL